MMFNVSISAAWCFEILVLTMCAERGIMIHIEDNVSQCETVAGRVAIKLD